MNLGTMQSASIKVPGAAATSVHGLRIWDLLLDVLCQTSTLLRFGFLSAKRTSARKRADFGQVWPMPLPYPEVHLRPTRDDEVEVANKKGLNFCVLVLNRLATSCMKGVDHTPPFGTPLSKQQWSAVKRLRPLVAEWNNFPEVTSSDMGRAASKMESVEDVLHGLETEVAEISRDLRSYKAKNSSGPQRRLDFAEAVGTVVGTVKRDVAHVAKAVEPDRLRFWKTPSFDPCGFLDRQNAQTYANPLEFAEKPAETDFVPPRVKVRVNRASRVKFLELLDSTERLSLLKPDCIRPGFLNGVFCVPKDAERDRMVLDARPPNGLEKTEDRWIRSLASTHQLLHFFVEPAEEVLLFAEDLREFYHAFQITEHRLKRNALEMPVKPRDVRHLKCYESWMDEETVLYPALATMAMGDCNAVSYGQASHLGVILQSGALPLSAFITLTGRPGRSKMIAGLMIDDLVLLQRIQRGQPAHPTESSLAIKTIRDAYERSGLPRHEGKAVYGEKKGSFWGLQFDGEAASARPSLTRCIPLVRIIAEVVRLKHCTVSLLEVISGSLISIFQTKRRFMSILDEIYSAQRGRSKGDVIWLPPSLQEELLSACALVVLSSINFRTRPSRRVVASDSSSTKEAAACCFLTTSAVSELQKHALQKGLWNRLLSPDRAYLRQKGLLGDEEELPDKQYCMHPAFEEIVSSQQFQPFGPVATRSRRCHINLGEISAALSAERRQGLVEPDSYYLHLQDSQVSLAALTKGRSSSKAVNKLIRSSIADHAGSGVRPFYAFVRSAKNPADDPTRSVALRQPSRNEALWLRDLEVGRTEKFDAFLEEASLGAKDLQGLPEASELGAPVVVDAMSSKESRKVEKVKRRNAEDGRRSSLRAREGLQQNDAPRANGLGAGATGCEKSFTSGPGPAAPRDCRRLSAEAESGGGAECPRRSGDVVGSVEKPFSGAVWMKEVLDFEKNQFVSSKEFSNLDAALKSGPGILDLYSGSGGIARACASSFGCWVLTFDIKNGSSQDLSCPMLQERLLSLIRRGAFRAMVAGPVCASFSAAVTPPCRTFQYPAGVPWCSLKQQAKNTLGNEQLRFVQRLVRACLRHKVRFVVENPNGSWMWKQVGELSWDDIMAHPGVGDLKVDYCMFGCPWQKRTRFRTDLQLRDQKLFCTSGQKHVRLRGRCKEKGVNYTQLAEPYPRPLCHGIATAIGLDCNYFVGLKKKLDIASCARGTHARIGEAKNPGPRRRQARSGDLSEVELLEPATVAMRSKVWQTFTGWVTDQAGPGLFPWVLGQPATLVDLLISFGHSAFKEGMPLLYYRHLLVHVQKECIAIRPFMPLAWQLVFKWEQLEPTSHRPPLPEPLLLAMAALGISWRWRSWSACLVFSFYGGCRVGEVLAAKREHLLLPSDLMSSDPVAYLRIVNPKSRRRGARVQYSTFDEAKFIPFLEAVWGSRKHGSMLYGASPGAFRSRWNAILKRLEIPLCTKITPGSLRAGGAVHLHKKGLAIADVMWRLRIQHQKTLTFYLQEVTAESVLPSLPGRVRNRIRLLRGLLPVLLLVETVRTTDDP